MTHVYILTVTDHSDFGRVCHQSVWSSWAGADAHANGTVLPEIKETLEPEYHRALGVDICQMEVHHAHV